MNRCVFQMLQTVSECVRMLMKLWQNSILPQSLQIIVGKRGLLFAFTHIKLLDPRNKDRFCIAVKLCSRGKMNGSDHFSEEQLADTFLFLEGRKLKLNHLCVGSEF